MKHNLNKFLIIFFLWVLFSSFSGFEYKNIETEAPLSIHIIELDPKNYELKPTLAKDDKIGRDTVLNIATRNNAKAAINGGFFKTVSTLDGLPMGVLKIDGKWISLPRKQRAAIGWNNSSDRFFIDQAFAKASINFENQTIPVDGTNRERKENENILYIESFFNLYTPHPPNLKSNMILSNNFFLALDFDDELNKVIKFNSFSYNISLSTSISLDNAAIFENLEHIVGGTPVLIYNKKKIYDYSSEKTIETFLSKKHARTAIGIKENGNLIFLAVDSNAPYHSIGMTVDELRDFMYEIGCTYAINLDGGGSSCMVIDNQIINDPKGDEDDMDDIRKVSDAILIFEKSNL